MRPDGSSREKVTLVTLGPTGTCHERAAIEYMGFQGVEDFEVDLVGDFFDGLERIRGKDNAFLIQCSAHPKVHEITERHWAEVFVVDTFIYPTKALAVLSRREIEQPRTLGLVPATSGYIDPAEWDEIIDVQSKPIVAAELLAGRYDAGLTHLEHLAAHPDDLWLIEEIGEIDTTWVVYGTTRRFKGKMIGIPSADLFCAGATVSRCDRKVDQHDRGGEESSVELVAQRWNKKTVEVGNQRNRD